MNKSTLIPVTKYIFILFFSIFCTTLTAHTKGGIDLTATMKQMRFEFNQAMKSESPAVFNQHINNFKTQLKTAQQFPFNEQRIEKATEGLTKVANIVNLIALVTTPDELKQAQQKLAVIDNLREQYHDKKPSLWERFYEIIFGADEHNPPLILLQ